jgi:tetratricopeptide (TPR) repeat protein
MAQAAQGIGSVLMAQGRWPEALASYREEYDASGHAGAEVNTQYSLMDLAGVFWRLGRYPEAEQSLDRIGSKASTVVAAEVNQIRADMLLSRRQFAASAALCRKVLAEGGLNNDRTVEVKLTLSRALLGSGARKEADEVMAQVDASKITNPRLIAERELAKAEALPPHSYPGEATSYAEAAERFFEKSGNLERQWHCLLAVARLANAREDAQKAVDAFAQLQQKWDAENYASYARRPDIQVDRAQLQKLLGRN